MGYEEKDHERFLLISAFSSVQEMNRIRRAALSFGFHELLEAMATMLERECTLLPGTAHPSASMQLSHAANGLRSPAALDIVHTIMPLQTNFAAGDR